MDGPRFHHDCGLCEFKGRSGAFDVWFHRREPQTWIARYSDEGAGYESYSSLVISLLKRHGGILSEAWGAIVQMGALRESA